MAMVLPVAKVGVDWPVGWKVVVMASIGSPSIAIAPGDGYVLACFLATVGHLLLAGAWVTHGVQWLRGRAAVGGRVRWIASIGAAGCFTLALLPLVAVGLLGGVHVGLAFYLAAPIVLALSVRAGTRSASDSSSATH